LAICFPYVLLTLIAAQMKDAILMLPAHASTDFVHQAIIAIRGNVSGK
jgi:hypothetical protein